MTSHLARRAFLERTAGAAMLAAMTARSARSASSMFVSLNGALTNGKNVAWPEFAQLASRTGYGGVDWSLGPARTAGLDATRSLLNDLKLKPTIVNLPLQTPFAGDDESFKQKLPQLADDAAFTAGIGCQKMMLVLSATAPAPKDEYRKLVRDRLAMVSEVLQKSNIRLGLEFLGPLYMRGGAPSPCPARGGGPPRAAGPAPANAPAAAGGGQRAGGQRIPFIWTLPETVDLAKDCGPNIGAVLDAWHWHHSGGTVADIVAAGKSRIVHVHVSDARNQPPEDVCDSQRLMPGEGVINLVGFFQALQKIDYADGVSPEPLGRIPPEMSADDAARLGMETTTAVMKKAGVS
jgi:sugar phosphate isomerase/epimerase